MQKHATKYPGMAWNGRAWVIRVRAIRRSLTVEKTETVRAPLDEPPFARRNALKAEATAEVEAKAAMLPPPPPPPPRSSSLAAYAERWIASVEAEGATPMYAETRAGIVDDHILPYLGAMDVAAIRSRDLKAWSVWLSTRTKKNGKPYAHSYLLTVTTTLRQLMAWVKVEADLNYSALEDVRFKVAGREKVAKEVLNLDEIEGLVRAAVHEHPRDRMLIACGLGLGLRFSEVSATEWPDFDLETRRLAVVRSQVHGNVGKVKTAATKRDVVIPVELVEQLKEYRAWQVRQQVRGLNRGLVFPAAEGGYCYPKSLNEVLARCCDRAGIDKHITTHCMRKTLNNQLRKSGVQDTVVRAMIGHSTEEMTRLYSKVEIDERDQAHAQAGVAAALKVGRSPL